MLLPCITLALGFHGVATRPGVSAIRASPRARVALSNALTLDGVAERLKMDVVDLVENVIGLESRDQRFGIRVVGAELERGPSGSLGIELVEMLRATQATDTRGLVLVSSVDAARFVSDAQLEPGDTVCAVGPAGGELVRVEGLNYDETVNAIGAFADEQRVKLVVKRLVERSTIKVTAELPNGETTSFETLAGSNLRMSLIQRDIKIYDARTRRFDMPYAKGDCAGEGLCGTCLVNVQAGAELLSKPDGIERELLDKRPVSWRAACRTVVGADNEAGELRVRLQPQADFEDER